METIRVILADDYPEIRSILLFIMEKAGGIEILGETSSGEEAVQLVDRFSPDVLILDLKLPGMEGAEVVRKLNASQSHSRVLVLSHYLEKQKIMELLDLGASGYIAKDEAFEWLVPAIQAVMKGKRCLSPMVEKQLSDSSLSQFSR